MEEAETISFKLILPSKRLPAVLSHITSAPVGQFLVGYRNVLVEEQSGVSWGLVKNSSFCGRAFVFDITETEAHNIQQIKKPSEYIQMVGNNYILLKMEKEIIKLSNTISAEVIAKLVDEVGGNTKININLIKSSFDSFEDFEKIAGQGTKAIAVKQKIPQTSLVDKVKIQFNGKKLSGKELLEVPSILKETGNWSEDKSVALKLNSN